MQLEWRVIESLPQYEVSNTGLVRRIATQRIRKNQHNQANYQQVSIKGKTYLIHRLVAKAFIPNPNNFPIVNHKDENPTNNNIDNLEWCNEQYNVTYGTSRYRAASKNRKEHKGKSVYCVELDKVFKNGNVAAKELGLSQSSINSCCTGRLKTTSGYHFRYHIAETAEN